MSIWAFGPHTPIFDWNMRSYYPFRCDGIIEAKRAMYMPDLMAGCVLYVLLWESGYKAILAVWFVIDILYFGPLALAMPASVVMLQRSK